MNDETLTDYKDVLNQIHTGNLWLQETFGIRPKIGWQIDPFGHSAVTPSILKELGFEAIILNRVGSTISKVMTEKTTGEFIWSGVQKDSKILGKIL